MIIDINKRLQDKKEMDKLGEEYKDGIVLIDGNNFKTLFGKTVYPVAYVANLHLQSGQSTYKLACGGFVNLTEEERVGEWHDRLMKRPANYVEPKISDLKGVPIQAIQMLFNDENKKTKCKKRHLDPEITE